MKINFLSYLDPFKYSGGGELDSRMIIERGRQRGHEIRVLARRTGKLSKLIPPRMNFTPADLNIIADIFNCPDDGLDFDRALVERVVSHEPYMHLDNAYVDVCWRPALPCHGDQSYCPSGCGAPRAKWLYCRSLANIFLSPLHHRVVSGLLGGDGVPNPLITRPLVDVDMFHNRNGERDIEYLYVGTIDYYKGYGALKQQFADGRILLIGRNNTSERLCGAHIPYVPHEQLPNYYNRAKHFVHLPCWPEPQGRCVVEAALCGCELITNENVGATSFDFDIADRDIISDAPDHLWREIEKRCAN
jgi:glycosyltransferase involved in cell wall biosynthesis